MAQPGGASAADSGFEPPGNLTLEEYFRIKEAVLVKLVREGKFHKLRYIRA